MNTVKIPLKDIQLNQLNSECLRLASKFARLLKSRKRVILRMQDEDILLQISDHAHRTRSKELKAVYADLKQEILKSVHQSMEK